MKNNPTSFRDKMKLRLQISTPTIPAIGALLMIVVLPYRNNNYSDSTCSVGDNRNSVD